MSVTPNHRGHRLLAANIDWLMRSLEETRGHLLGDIGSADPATAPRVVEIGVGTGLNFAHYGAVAGLWGVEPDPHMLARARRRAQEVAFPVQLSDAPAEALPFDDAMFDLAVVTWVLCTVEAPRRALDEVMRVLRPGGRMIYAEHTRSRFPVAARLQQGLNPLWRRIAGGCQMVRDSEGLIKEAGFVVEARRPIGREAWTLFPIYSGTAHKPT